MIPEDSSATDLVGLLARQMTEALGGFVGEELTPRTNEAISDTLLQWAESMPGISDMRAGKPIPAWLKMTTWDKLLWFLVWRLVPVIGRYIDELHRDIAKLDGTSKRALWTHRNPDEIVLVELTVSVRAPLNRIKLDLTQS